MDALTFSAEILKAIAWPVAVVALALLFRAELRHLLSRVTKLRHNETEVEFSELLGEVIRKKQEVLPTERQESLSLEEPRVSFARRAPESPYRDLILASPRDAILAAWRDLEFAALEALSGRIPKGSETKPLTPRLIGQLLFKEKILNEGQLELFNDLRSLRNQATHNVDFLVRAPAAESYCNTIGALREEILRQAK
jgi:hypothetical protein